MIDSLQAGYLELDAASRASMKVAKIADKLAGHIWITQQHLRYYPAEMATRHIVNTIRMIEEGRMPRASCSGIPNAKWVEIFRAEIARRKQLAGLAD